MRKYLGLFWVLLLLISSCKFKPGDNVNWDQNLVAPIIKSRVSLADALSDSSIVQQNGDNSLTVVFRDTVVDLPLSEYLVVPDTQFAAKVSLQTISLSTDTITQDITLGQIARQLIAEGNPVGQTILNFHGQNMFFFPGVNDLSSDDITVDASQFFDDADLISGWMVIEIENNLPVDVTSATFHLRNNGNLSDTLVRKTIPGVPAGQTRSDSADLAGKTVESQMAGQLEDIDVAGGTNVPIDTNDYIRIRIIVKDLYASRATAVFPAQTVIDDYSRINYNFGTDLRIRNMRAASGELRLEALSTLQDTIEFIYSLPTTIQNGVPVSITDRLIPDTVLGLAQANIQFPLDGYYIDMTVNGDSVNMFPYYLVGNLLYSGRKNTMDLSDSIDVTYGLYDIKPSYIEGYLGQETFSFTENLNLDFFNSILGGTLELENPRVDLTFMNSIGVDGELKVNQLRASNSRTGEILDLTGNLMSSPVEVRGPKLPNVGQTVTTKINLNKDNSNIDQIISMLPDLMEFDMEVLVNKNGNPALMDNFATNESRLSAFLDIEVPLHGIANNLTLQDTVPLNISEATLPDGVEKGTLKLVTSNWFPFDARVQIYFYDASGILFDSLMSDGPGLVGAGQVDQNLVVTTPGEAVLSAQFDQDKLDDLRLRGAEAVIRFSLSTKPDGTPVKLYTTYGIDFQLVGDFIYSFGL